MGRTEKRMMRGDEKKEEDDDGRGSNVKEEMHDSNLREVNARGISKRRFHTGDGRQTGKLRYKRANGKKRREGGTSYGGL